MGSQRQDGIQVSLIAPATCRTHGDFVHPVGGDVKQFVVCLIALFAINIRFHLYIHDHILDKPIGTLTSRVNTLMFFGYLFFLAQTETNPPNKSKSVFVNMTLRGRGLRP